MGYISDFETFAAPFKERPEFQTIISEARLGLNLISPFLDKNKRILEFGAGTGMLSGFLHKSGFKVDSVEPGGFANFDLLESELTGHSGHRSVYRDLDELKSLRNTYSFIFSIHVLEHVQNLETEIPKMASLLADDGRMLHLCPNYVIPYEPHINKFYMPWAKPSYEVNFITSFKLREIAHKNDLYIEFQSGIMTQFLDRLQNDPIFARRQRNLNFIKYFRPLISALPAVLSSPMVCEIKKNN